MGDGNDVANDLDEEMKKNEDKMDELNKKYDNLEREIESLEQGSDRYKEAIKEITDTGIERSQLQIKMHVDGFSRSVKNPGGDMDQGKFQDAKKEFRKKMNETVEDAINREKEKTKNPPGPLEENYRNLFGDNYENAIQLPRMIFESPYGLDVFEKTFWERFWEWVTRGKISPGDSQFAKEFREINTKDPAMKYIYDTYSANQSNFYQKGILRPIQDVIEQVTGRTLESYNEDFRKKMQDKTSKVNAVTRGDLNSQFTPEQMKQMEELFKKKYGAKDGSTLLGWLSFATSLGTTVLVGFLGEAALCQLGMAQSGCRARPPNQSQWITTNIAFQTLNEAGNKQYCVLDSETCKSYVTDDIFNAGTTNSDGEFIPDSPDDQKAGNNCCIECNTVCCNNLFSIFNSSSSKACANKTCCGPNVDLYGLSDPKCAGLDPNKEDWKKLKCSSTREGWEYQMNCVNGLDAIGNVVKAGVNVFKNAPGDIQGILRTVITIIIVIGVVWLIERIANSFFTNKSNK